jgi:hypothetical protein
MYGSHIVVVSSVLEPLGVDRKSHGCMESNCNWYRSLRWEDLSDRRNERRRLCLVRKVIMPGGIPLPISKVVHWQK